MKKKVCLISSSGGHFEQLLMLKKIEEKSEIFFVTEKTKYNQNEKNLYFLKQVNREEKTCFFFMVVNLFLSLKILISEKPDVIISTGALSVIPMFLLGKIFNKKLIYIESFAKSNSPTLSGKFIYKFADLFIVQWADMKKFYPKAVLLGSIY
ncbi:PssD/Cps14F family polysaccharide biosynthesis glycosyltransferase [Enterococcus avium]|uniref:PssD/Cps14F family polysaccharide biosynthesis glycosyltransferase n=1 Tax=Enterococcus avium TaxID=33945 RepID=UPI003850816B